MLGAAKFDYHQHQRTNEMFLAIQYCWTNQSEVITRIIFSSLRISIHTTIKLVTLYGSKPWKYGCFLDAENGLVLRKKINFKSF